MSTKRKFSSLNQGETHFSGDFLMRMRSTEYLESCLSVGSKNRLHQYKRNLAKTRGSHKPEFDGILMNMVREYAWDKDEFDSELSYLANLKDEQGEPFSRNLKIYNTIQDAIERFAEKDYTSFRWNENYRKSLEEMKREFSRQNFRPLLYKCDNDIVEALPKKDTHSGYFWILSGKKRKGDNLEGILKLYEEKEKIAVEEGNFNTPILIGFRTQASGEYEDDGSRTNKCKHKLRVVSMIDLLQIIGELKFSKPIQNYLGLRSYYAGGKDQKEISSIITSLRCNFRRFMSIDYSSFDQTISSWLIEDAFEILKQGFKLTDYEEKLFYVIRDSFIHKNFILNEGVVESHKGVPSGSMFTQIIDSIVNVLVIKTYFNHLESKNKMITMGDDNAIFFNVPVNMEDLSTYLMKNFGLIVKVDEKSNEGLTDKDEVKFLSRYWTWHGEWRHPKQLLSRMAYPERHREYNDIVGPEHVVFAFILTYRLGMEKLIDVGRFMRDYPISRRFIWDNVDSRYLPGALAYIREYT